MEVNEVLELSLKSIPHVKKILKEVPNLRFYADKEKGIGYIRKIAGETCLVKDKNGF